MNHRQSLWEKETVKIQGATAEMKSSTDPFIFFKYFIYLFFNRGGGREGEKHQCVVASRTPPTGDLAHNPGTGNPLNFPD